MKRGENIHENHGNQRTSRRYRDQLRRNVGKIPQAGARHRNVQLLQRQRGPFCDRAGGIGAHPQRRSRTVGGFAGCGTYHAELRRYVFVSSKQGGSRQTYGCSARRKTRRYYHAYAGRLYVRPCCGCASCVRCYVFCQPSALSDGEGGRVCRSLSYILYGQSRRLSF